MRVLITQGEGAGGRGGQYRAILLLDGAPDGGDVLRPLPTSLVDQSIGDQGDTTAMLIIQEVYAIADGIEYLHQVFA